jgi:hypothetical protein
MYTLTTAEETLLKKLSSPAKIQDFLDTLIINYEAKGETCRSPRRVLRDRTAHCMEGAMFAALALRIHGQKPLLLDLRSRRGDDDHVVALFRMRGYWGAISKTNHAVLRYREPVYRTIRELALSYFHEYFLDNGTKTLREYSAPFDLSQFDDKSWMTSEKDLYYITRALDRSRHFFVAPASTFKGLRKADPIERAAGKLIEWDKKGKHLFK